METVRRLGQHVSGKKPGLAHEASLARTVSSEAKLADLGYEQGKYSLPGNFCDNSYLLDNEHIARSLVLMIC